MLLLLKYVRNTFYYTLHPIIYNMYNDKDKNISFQNKVVILFAPSVSPNIDSFSYDRQYLNQRWETMSSSSCQSLL